MESCQAEIKQQNKLVMLTNPTYLDIILLNLRKYCWTKSDAEDKIKLTLTEHLDKEKEKALAPAANHVQQPWNVYSQAYMKAARDSIATQIRGQVFKASASRERQLENKTVLSKLDKKLIENLLSPPTLQG